jgi:pimeloyl-ACP methyl ester carboxylesterase
MRMQRFRASLIAVVLLAAGCGGDSVKPDPAQPKTGSQPAAAAQPTTPSRTIRFRASDGVRLEGQFSPGRGERAPAVVLIHEYRGGPEQWEPLVPVLHRAGYAVLNYASRSPEEIDETVLARDAIGAVGALRRRRDVDPDRIALVGASIGGSTAVWVTGIHRRVPVRAAVGLSAVEGPALIEAGTKGRFRPHDLLLISDKKELSQARNIREDAGGRGVTTWTSPFQGHGVRLLPSAQVRKQVLDWLRTHLGAS